MKKKKTPKVFLAIEVLICTYLLYTIFFHQQNLMNNKKAEMEQVQQMIQEEKNINRQLQSEKEKVNTDEYIEKIAREKLGMVKKNERIFFDVNN